MKKLEYAGFWERAGALMIDVVIIAIPSAVVGYMFSSTFADNMALRGADEVTSALGEMLWAKLAGIAAVWVYYAAMESSRFQATLGKYILGLRVVDSEYHCLTYGQATGRFFGRFLSAIPFGLGFLVQPFTSRRQTWHDMLASCVVIKSNASCVALPMQYKEDIMPISGQPADIPVDEEIIEIPAHSPVGIFTEEEETFYTQAAKEIDQGSIRQGLWTKITLDENDPVRQRAAYIRFRVAQLMHESACLRPSRARDARRKVLMVWWRTKVSRSIGWDITLLIILSLMWPIGMVVAPILLIMAISVYWKT